MASTAFQEVLECTICLDVPASPIHNCSNGHIICGICSEKIDKCGLCQSELKVSVLAERLSRQLDFRSKCPNYDSGCCNLIASAEIKDHIGKCYYRNAVCNEQKIEACKNVAIPLKNFPQHLREKHESNKTSPLTRRFTSRTKDLMLGQVPFPAVPTEKDSRSFILHGCINNDVIYFWMTVLGDKEEASKYMCEISLEKELDGGKQMQCTWTLPVLPYHDHPQFNVPVPQYVSIMASFLHEFCEMEEVENNKTKYTFQMSHRIL